MPRKQLRYMTNGGGPVRRDSKTDNFRNPQEIEASVPLTCTFSSSRVTALAS